MSTLICPNCSTIIKKGNKFCNSSCAATFNNKSRVRSAESKAKTSASLKGKPNPNKGKQLVPRLKKQCDYCGDTFEYLEKAANATCGKKECISKACQKSGKKSAAMRKTRSADEIKLYEYCVETFPDAESNKIIADGWDADIVLAAHKIAILWNGPWHYKEMNMSNHSLKQVQTRDKIKKKLFESLGWSVIVYEDRYFTPESAFGDLLQRMVGPHGLEPRSAPL